MRLFRILAIATVASGPVMFTTPADARVVERIAAVVGNDVILASEVEEKAAPLMTEVAAIANKAQRATRSTAVRREVLDRLVDEQLIVQQALELKITITSEDVDRSIEQIKKDNNLTDVQLREALRNQGMTMAAYRQDIKKQLIRFRVLNAAVASRIAVSDSDVRNYYDRHMKSGAETQVRVSHIFIPIPSGADAAVIEERQRLAAGLAEKARAGEDFAKLVREHSEDAATRNEAGDLGFFGKGMLPKPVEEAVFGMKTGDVSDPVRADQGFHVFKLVDRKAKDTKAFDAVRDEIRGRLRQKEVEKQTKSYLSELRKKTLVDIRI